jgi:hypothetical protein
MTVTVSIPLKSIPISALVPGGRAVARIGAAAHEVETWANWGSGPIPPYIIGNWSFDTVEYYTPPRSIRSDAVADILGEVYVNYAKFDYTTAAVGFISFRYKVSLNPASGVFQFAITSGESALYISPELSGDIGWTYFEIEIPAPGQYAIEVFLLQAGGAGINYAWIDDIFYPVAGVEVHYSAFPVGPIFKVIPLKTISVSKFAPLLFFGKVVFIPCIPLVAAAIASKQIGRIDIGHGIIETETEDFINMFPAPAAQWAFDTAHFYNPPRSIKHPPTVAQNSTSAMQISAYFDGPGSIEFVIELSPGGSNFDGFYFGEMIGETFTPLMEWQAAIGSWERFGFEVTAPGLHVFQWRLIQDNSWPVTGVNEAWVDDIRVRYDTLVNDVLTVEYARMFPAALWRVRDIEIDKKIYKLKLTGYDDGLPDVYLPMKSFSGTKRDKRVGTFSAVIPNIEAYEAEILARPAGSFWIEAGYKMLDGREPLNTIVVMYPWELQLDKGARSRSGTVYGPAVYYPHGTKAIEVDKVTYKAVDAEGKRRFRADVDLFLETGDTFIYGVDQIEVGEISYTVDVNQAFMEVKEL